MVSEHFLSENSSIIPMASFTTLVFTSSSQVLVVPSSNGHSIMMFTINKRKDDYRNGEVPKLNSTNLKYGAWKTEHNMVMSWLVNSMTNEVRENLILHKTRRHKKSGMPQMRCISTLKTQQRRYQGDLSIT